MVPAMARRIVEADKQRVLELIRQGHTRRTACESLAWSKIAFDRYLERHKDFRAQVQEAERIRAITISDAPRPIDGMEIEAFRRYVFGRDTFHHQKLWIEWMQADATRILIETCPDSAKTTTIKDAIHYWIAKNPEIRVGYMTHSYRQARDHVDGLRLVIEENQRLREVAGELKPASHDNRPWSADKFMVAQRSFDTGKDQADATVKAFGHKSQLAGTRLDVLIVDDVDGKDDISPEERLDIFNRLMTIGRSRLGVAGKLIVICNRWDVNDVAGLIEKRAEERPGRWKIFKTPAIVRERDPKVPTDWGEVIWPERFGTKTGIVGDAWTQKRAWEYFDDVRWELSPRLFALMYQCDPSQDEEQEFSEEVIQRALERGREYSVGDRPAEAIGLGTMDPAGETGGAAAGAFCLLPDGKILVTDIRWARNVGIPGLQTWMREYSSYKLRYWALETQGGFSGYKTDPVFKAIAAEQHASMEYLFTNQNKIAEGVGVTSLHPIVAEQLIIPNKTDEDRERMAPLVNQLRSYRRAKWDGTKWVKPKNQTEDCVMVLWFVVRLIREKRLAASKGLGASSNEWKSPYATSWDGGTWTVKPA